MAAPQTTFGASIITTTPHKTQAQSDLPALTPTVSHSSTTPLDASISPCSPFYQHPPASHERVPAAYLAHKTPALDISTAEKGLYLNSEYLTPSSVDKKNPFCSSISVNTSKECTMWPSRQTLVHEKLQQKKKNRSARFCACAGVRHNWEQLNKKHRLMVRIVLALLLVGAMVGLGVGISKAVHGGYYTGNGSSVST